MQFIRKSFGRKLAFTYTILFVLVFAGTYAYSLKAVEKHAINQLEESVSLQAKILGHIITPELIQKKDQSQLVHLVYNLSKEENLRLTVVDSNGSVLADSGVAANEIPAMENHKNRPEIQEAFKGKAGKSVRYSMTIRMKMLYMAFPVINDRGAVVGVLRFALPLNIVAGILHSTGRPLSLGLTVGILLILFLSLFLTRSVTRRIGKLTEAAECFTAGDFSRKAMIGSGDELEILAKTMNQMAGTIKERINEIENERTKLSAILTNMTEGVIAVNCHNRIIAVNSSAERMFEIREDSVCGRSFIEVVRNKKIDEMMAEAIKEQRFISMEIELPQWETKILRVSALGISKVEQGVAGIFVMSDISEVRKLENVRREFVANVSHELRTPLTSIKGFIETLLGGAISDSSRSKEFLRMIEEDTARLTRSIDDLLELSEIESNQASLKIEPLVLSEQVDKIIPIFERRLAEKKIVLNNGIKADKAIRVMADVDGLKQVLVNLLDNAIKYNQENGKISLRAEEFEGQVKIVIEDTGCGIPKESIARVFERFFRVDKARSRDLGGTGLGLAIVKHIVELCGGKIWCESRLNKGSAFFFTLPEA